MSAPVDAVEAYAAAGRAVDEYMNRRGFTHRTLRDRAVDVVATVCKQHGIDEGTKAALVEVIVTEAAAIRLRATEDRLDSALARSGKSNGRA